MRASVGDVGCNADPLPDGAIVQIFAGAGFTGERRVRTLFSDGRVTQEGVPRPQTALFHVGAGRMQRFDADLVAAGLFEQAEGCWWRSRKEPPPVVYDGYEPPAGISVRHNGRVYTFKGDPERFPEPVARARKVLDALDRELDAQGGDVMAH